MTDKEKTIKELKEALNSLDITNKYRLSLIRAIEYLQEEPVSEELEEEIDVYLATKKWREINETFSADRLISFARHFAKWQEKKDQSTIELAEDHAMLAGMEKTKEQMMAKAADMVVGYWMPNGLMLTVDETENCYNIDEGDKVKVIVIKEN